MATATNYDPVKAGFRVADPIKRKPRSAPSKPQPKPRYADSVWWSFSEGQPLEVTVPTRSVDDTVRLLKRSARYLERHRKVEVRVQISVEPVLDPETNEPVKPAKSVVKFLGHKPWLLGRRIAKEASEAPEVPQPPAPAPVPAPREAGQHRRRVAGTRPGPAHAKSALHRALVGSVITPTRPPCPPAGWMWGSRSFCVVHMRTQTRVFASCYRRHGPVVSCHPRLSFRGQAIG